MSKEGQGEPYTVLVVDDAPNTVEVIRRNLESRQYVVLSAASVMEATRILAETRLNLVITDLKMPGVSGMDLIRHVRENFRETSIIMITGYATVQGAVDAVKLGAEAYLAKPFTDEELFHAVDAARSKQHTAISTASRVDPEDELLPGVVGASRAMQELAATVKRAAASDATVLIRGESGTGKELVARAIHYLSVRRVGPIFAVNCGSIPALLLESELFGYARGSFTGATQDRIGYFQAANHGTIFLDEISETSSSMQVSLLRVLQDHQVLPVGSRTPVAVDCRVVAATNRDISALVKKGIFREDLYYRLNVVEITVPPLREREDDVLLLARRFLSRLSGDSSDNPKEFSPPIIAALRRYRWPGNVRELENIVQRLVVMTDEPVIDASDLPEYMRFSAIRETGLDRTLEEVERGYIRRVLEYTGGNKSEAARILGIDRKTLREKLRQDGPGGPVPPSACG